MSATKPGRRVTLRMKIIIGVVLLGVVGFGFLAVKSSRAGYESAAYEVVEREGKLELRRYDDMPVAATAMKGGDGSAFNRLFRFISGANESGEKIAMTTPVFMPATDEARTTEMQFVVPAGVAKEGTPRPDSGAVSVKTVRGGLFAALRFKGHRSSEKQREALAELRRLCREKGWAVTGNPVFAYYDPPWTPELMRRNEVLLRVRR